MRYCFVQDDSSHWYIIPADKRDDFEEWAYEEGGNVPEWAYEVGGWISLITFENWRREK